jgi:hypothetical protein
MIFKTEDQYDTQVSEKKANFLYYSALSLSSELVISMTGLIRKYKLEDFSIFRQQFPQRNANSGIFNFQK